MNKLSKTEQLIIVAARKTRAGIYCPSPIKNRLVNGTSKAVGTRENKACQSLIKKGLAKQILVVGGGFAIQLINQQNNKS